MSTANDYDFEIEEYESYFGDKKQVINIMENCTICGGKLLNNYLSDYKNLYIKESKRCSDCGTNDNKKMHKIN